MGVAVIVAPYEADAQLAYLCHIGFCDAVLTEDSDILVYAAICGLPFRVLYKFDKSGVVQAITLADAGLLDNATGTSYLGPI
jgi:exonuclease-1